MGEDTWSATGGASTRSGRKIRVADLSPAVGICPKPIELIRIRGHAPLNLQARRIATVLWDNAQRQGFAEGRNYTIEISQLRSPGHHGNEGVSEAVLALMQTVLTVRSIDGAVTNTQLLGGNDMDARRGDGVLAYSLDQRLVEVLRESIVWGNVALDVLYAITSKYTLSLYENACSWVNLNKVNHRKFSICEFREQLGVEDGRYKFFGSLNQDILTPSLKQINVLADFKLQIFPIKTGKCVTHLRIYWQKKSPEEQRKASAELRRSSRGRAARIHRAPDRVHEPTLSAHRMARQARSEHSTADE